MALNNIRLNSTLLTELFKHSLVESTESSPKKSPSGASKKAEIINSNSATTEWKYLGEYRKNILLIVRYPDTTYLPDVQLNFLTSVLGACKLSLADVAILNISHAPSGLYKDVQGKFKSTTSILLGIAPQEFEMPLNFPEFQVQPFNHCTFLHTPVLEKLETDKVLKSKFWVCLRKIFGV